MTYPEAQFILSPIIKIIVNEIFLLNYYAFPNSVKLSDHPYITSSRYGGGGQANIWQLGAFGATWLFRRQAKRPRVQALPFCSVLFYSGGLWEEMKSHKLSDAPNFIENHFKMEHCI